jgi:cAMP phosphodiesterase
VKISLAQSSIGSGPLQQILASYIINDEACIDAGSIGFFSPLDVQKNVQHIFLSHSHMDHVASLPIFIDNTYVHGPDCATVHAGEHTHACLQSDIFNDRLWPDMIRLSGEETPFLRLNTLTSEQTVEVAGLKVTPVSLLHIIPTFGFIIEDATSAIAIVSDTSPTERIWELINQTANLKAVFLEASFPNEMQWLAEKAMHLTPALFDNELKKLAHEVPIIAVHIKIAFEAQVRSQIAALGRSNVQIGEPGSVYEF